MSHSDEKFIAQLCSVTSATKFAISRYVPWFHLMTTPSIHGRVWQLMHVYRQNMYFSRSSKTNASKESFSNYVSCKEGKFRTLTFKSGRRKKVLTSALSRLLLDGWTSIARLVSSINSVLDLVQHQRKFPYFNMATFTLKSIGVDLSCFLHYSQNFIWHRCVRHHYRCTLSTQEFKYSGYLVEHGRLCVSIFLCSGGGSRAICCPGGSEVALRMHRSRD